MKKLIVSLAMGASVLGVAAPASAQYYGDRDGYDRSDRGDRDDRYDRGDRWDRNDRDGRWGDTGLHPRDLQPRLNPISGQISRGLASGYLTPGEANRLRAEHRQIWQIATNYYRTGGIDRRELRDIDVRIARLQQQLRWERNDRDRRIWR